MDKRGGNESTATVRELAGFLKLSPERKLRLRDLAGHQIMRIYFPAPLRIIVRKVEAFQMRCRFNAHVSCINFPRFAVGRQELEANYSKSSFRKRRFVPERQD